MFWRLSSFDSTGKPSQVYIQGTIHIGDDRLYPVADSVLAAWKSADRLAGEISTEGWASFQQELQKHMIQSYTDAAGRSVYDGLSDSRKKTLYSVIDKKTADSLALFEPWVLNTSVSTYIYIKAGLSPLKAMDLWFITQANKEGRHMEGLDELETQFSVIQYGTYDEQLVLLQDSLDTIADSAEMDKITGRLYDAYIAGDVKNVAAILDSENKKSAGRVPFYKRYNTALFSDRNQAWSEKIESWLSEGGTTFIFAGCGHFVGKDSVFTCLKKNGAL